MRDMKITAADYKSWRAQVLAKFPDAVFSILVDDYDLVTPREHYAYASDARAVHHYSRFPFMGGDPLPPSHARPSPTDLQRETERLMANIVGAPVTIKFKP